MYREEVILRSRRIFRFRGGHFSMGFWCRCVTEMCRLILHPSLVNVTQTTPRTKPLKSSSSSRRNGIPGLPSCSDGGRRLSLLRDMPMLHHREGRPAPLWPQLRLRVHPRLAGDPPSLSSLQGLPRAFRPIRSRRGDILQGTLLLSLARNLPSFFPFLFFLQPPRFFFANHDFVCKVLGGSSRTFPLLHETLLGPLPHLPP